MRDVVAAILWGSCGIGIVLLFFAFRRRPASLRQTIQVLQKSPSRSTQEEIPTGTSDPLRGLQGVLGSMGANLMKSLGLDKRGDFRRKLRILDKSLERQGYEKMLGGSMGLILPLALWVALQLIGSNASIPIFIAGSVLLAVVGFWYPDIPLSEQIEKRKRAFRYAFSSYLDLVTVILAGGSGIETALQVAAEAGDGWAFERIRTALVRARLGNRTPWSVFAEVGEELDVSELRELAASISLAGEQGARIRDSLLVRADALRSAQLAEIEADAESRNEKMTLPVLVMVAGLILFIGYGAVQAITTDALPGISG